MHPVGYFLGRNWNYGTYKMNSTVNKRRINKGAFFDLAIVMIVLVGVKQSLLPITQLYAGPASTFSAMIVATLLMYRRDIKWADIGFNWPDSWIRTSFLTVVTIVLMFLVMGIVGWVVDQFVPNIGTSGRFDHIEGNLPAYLIMMATIWTHAAFFEELLFRAFIITHASKIFGGTKGALIFAAIFSAIFFGYRHYYYQGLNGSLTISALGLLLAWLYIRFGRQNILPLIIAHGLIDTLGMTYRYLGITE